MAYGKRRRRVETSSLALAQASGSASRGFAVTSASFSLRLLSLSASRSARFSASHACERSTIVPLRAAGAPYVFGRGFAWNVGWGSEKIRGSGLGSGRANLEIASGQSCTVRTIGFG